MDFYNFLKILVHMQLNLLKAWAITIVKNFLIVLKNKSTTDAIKNASKRAIPKTDEATGDLIGNKIAEKNNKYFKITKEISFKRIAFKRITFKNKREWNRNIKGRIYISRKKTRNYWWIKTSIMYMVRAALIRGPLSYITCWHHVIGGLEKRSD